MRRKRINYNTFLSKMIRAWMPAVIEMYAKPRFAWVEYFADYEGKTGPVTFEGTPEEIIEKLRRYQKGLEP